MVLTNSEYWRGYRVEKKNFFCLLYFFPRSWIDNFVENFQNKLFARFSENFRFCNSCEVPAFQQLKKFSFLDRLSFFFFLFFFCLNGEIQNYTNCNERKISIFRRKVWFPWERHNWFHNSKYFFQSIESRQLGLYFQNRHILTRRKIFWWYRHTTLYYCLDILKYLLSSIRCILYMHSFHISFSCLRQR